MLTYCNLARLLGRARVASILALAAAPLLFGRQPGRHLSGTGRFSSLWVGRTASCRQSTPVPSDFKGYPEVVAAFENLLKPTVEVNASYPGETSGSFITGHRT